MGYEFSAGGFLQKLGLGHTSLEEAAAHFRSRRLPVGFLSTADRQELVRIVRERHGREFAADRETAEQVLRHEFHYHHRWDMEMNQEPIPLGDTVDWRAAVGGDIEFNTMLTRHRYFQDLARAYWMTGDERYAAGWRDLLLSFDEDFEDDIVITGTRMSPLQAGIRCANWTRSLECMLHSPSVSDEELCRILDALWRQARHLHTRDPAHDYRSNHTNFQYAALYLVAILFPEFVDAPAWKEKARPALCKTLGMQVLESGLQYEHSPMYHVEVILPLLDLVLVARRNAVELPPEVPAALERLVAALGQIVGPDRRIPQIGDSDDFEARDMMTAGALLFGRGDFKFNGYEKVDYENLWLFGPGAEAEYGAIQADEPAGTSHIFTDAAWAVMRSSWAPERDQLLFTVPVSHYGGHLHADPLAVTGHFEGRPGLVDCGRFTYLDVYTDGERWRRYFKSTASHSTVTVDGEDAWRYADEWGWEPAPSGRLLTWFASTAIEHAAGSHEGYHRLEDPVSPRRDVLYLRPDYWVVLDRLDGRRRHVYRQYWQTGAASISLDDSTGTAVVAVDGTETLAVVPGPARGRRAVLEDWEYSREFNLRETGRHLYYELEGESAAFATLLVGARGGRAVVPKVTRRGSGRAETLLAEFSSGTDAVLTNREPGRPADAGGVSTDARLAVVRLGPDESVRSFYLCDGTRLSYRGRELAILAERPGRLAAHYGEGRVDLSADGRNTGIQVLFQGGGIVTLDGRTAAFARSGDLMTVSY